MALVTRPSTNISLLSSTTFSSGAAPNASPLPAPGGYSAVCREGGSAIALRPSLQLPTSLSRPVLGDPKVCARLFCQLEAKHVPRDPLLKSFPPGFFLRPPQASCCPHAARAPPNSFHKPLHEILGFRSPPALNASAESRLDGRERGKGCPSRLSSSSGRRPATCSSPERHNRTHPTLRSAPTRSETLCRRCAGCRPAFKEPPYCIACPFSGRPQRRFSKTARWARLILSFVVDVLCKRTVPSFLGFRRSPALQPRLPNTSRGNGGNQRLPAAAGLCSKFVHAQNTPAFSLHEKRALNSRRLCRLRPARVERCRSPDSSEPSTTGESHV